MHNPQLLFDQNMLLNNYYEPLHIRENLYNIKYWIFVDYIFHTQSTINAQSVSVIQPFCINKARVVLYGANMHIRISCHVKLRVTCTRTCSCILFYLAICSFTVFVGHFLALFFRSSRRPSYRMIQWHEGWTVGDVCTMGESFTAPNSPKNA